MTRNLGKVGRAIRAFIALVLFAAAALVPWTYTWIPLVFAASAVFVAFEALRGWCVLRACGVKTRF